MRRQIFFVATTAVSEPELGPWAFAQPLTIRRNKINCHPRVMSLPSRKGLLVVCLRLFNRQCRSYPFPLLSFHSMLKVTPILSIAPKTITTWQLSPIIKQPPVSEVFVLQNVIRWQTSSTATYTHAPCCTTCSVRRRIHSATRSPSRYQIT